MRSYHAFFCYLTHVYLTYSKDPFNPKLIISISHIFPSYFQNNFKLMKISLNHSLSTSCCYLFVLTFYKTHGSFHFCFCLHFPIISRGSGVHHMISALCLHSLFTRRPGGRQRVRLLPVASQ